MQTDELLVNLATTSELERVRDELYELIDLVPFGASRAALCAAHGFAMKACQFFEEETHDED